MEIGHHTKYNTKPSPPPPLPYLHITHTYRHIHLSPSGLRNGPTYVALAPWLNGPPCKWSGVEWNMLVEFIPYSLDMLAQLINIIDLRIIHLLLKYQW